MHIVGDMCKYGKPKAANTEVGENNHKVFAKRIGHHCRKQHKTYASQVAICLTEAFVLKKMGSAMGILDEWKVDECDVPQEVNGNINDECAKGTHFTIQHNGEKVEAKWQSVTEEHLLTFDQDVLEYLFPFFVRMKTMLCPCIVALSTSIMEFFIRCHPSYKGEGSWFDWVNVHFEESMLHGVTYLRASILAKFWLLSLCSSIHFLSKHTFW